VGFISVAELLTTHLLYGKTQYTTDYQHTAVLSVAVGLSHKVLHWTVAESYFLNGHGINIVNTNFWYFTYPFDRHVQIVTICSIILVARPN